MSNALDDVLHHHMECNEERHGKKRYLPGNRREENEVGYERKKRIDVTAHIQERRKRLLRKLPDHDRMVPHVRLIEVEFPKGEIPGKKQDVKAMSEFEPERGNTQVRDIPQYLLHKHRNNEERNERNE